MRFSRCILMKFLHNELSTWYKPARRVCSLTLCPSAILEFCDLEINLPKYGVILIISTNKEVLCHLCTDSELAWKL